MLISRSIAFLLVPKVSPCGRPRPGPRSQVAIRPRASAQDEPSSSNASNSNSSDFLAPLNRSFRGGTTPGEGGEGRGRGGRGRGAGGRGQGRGRNAWRTRGGRGRGRGARKPSALELEHLAAAALLRAQDESEGHNDYETADPAQEFDKSGVRLKFDKLELDESSPFYTPVLTDEDLAEDPEGHKSGYVAVIGKPNAGKSTLINAIVGQKLSAVTYKPQTTRHRIVGITSDKHYQMILFDTPGIIERKRNKLEERMMSAVVSSIQAAEAIIAVVDAADQPEEALAMFQPGDNWTGPPMAVLLNKADLLEEAQIAELETWYKDVCKAEVVFRGSAKNNVGVDEVKAWAVSVLPEGPTLYPKSIVSEQPERFFVSELIREKIFLLYSMEVPYSTQVEIIEFKERRNQKDYISAQILVEKESQVGIIVGKGGAALKRLGRDSREDIEQFLERSVYLELSVKVAADWREKKESLEQFGFYSPSYT